MKKLIMTGIVLSLLGCGEKDQAYYLKNPDQAEAKFQQCEHKISQAIKNNDKKAFEQAQKDTECQAAYNARKEHKRQQSEKERLEREAKEKALIEEAKQKLHAEFGKLEWQEFAAQYVNTECAKGYIGQRDYACRALKSLYDDKVAEGLAQLEKLSFDELKNQQKQYCSRDKRQFSACDIWKKALVASGEQHFGKLAIAELSPLKTQVCTYDDQHNDTICTTWQKIYNQKSKEAIDFYLKNYDALKQDYNQCIQRLAEIGNHWRDREKRETVSDYYPCAQARDARSQLGLGYDNFKTLME